MGKNSKAKRDLKKKKVISPKKIPSRVTETMKTLMQQIKDNLTSVYKEYNSQNFFSH
jgi:hypothetical protein